MWIVDDDVDVESTSDERLEECNWIDVLLAVEVTQKDNTEETSRLEKDKINHVRIHCNVFISRGDQYCFYGYTVVDDCCKYPTTVKQILENSTGIPGRNGMQRELEVYWFGNPPQSFIVTFIITYVTFHLVIIISHQSVATRQSSVFDFFKRTNNLITTYVVGVVALVGVVDRRRCFCQRFETLNLILTRARTILHQMF